MLNLPLAAELAFPLSALRDVRTYPSSQKHNKRRDLLKTRLRNLLWNGGEQYSLRQTALKSERKAMLSQTKIKAAFLCAAAILYMAPSTAQERPAQSQERPGASQPLNENRQERSEPGKALPSQPEPASPRAQNRDQNRSEQAPNANDKSKRQQSRDKERTPDNQRAQDNQPTQSPEDQRARNRDQTGDADQKNRRDQKRNSNRESDRDAPSRSDRAKDARDAQPNDGNRGSAQPNEQQRTRISASIRQSNIQPIRKLNFSVRVGTIVPASVRFYPVTPAIVEVYPQYRGYNFVLVDEEIVIIEPRTKKIVTIIGGTASVSRSRLSLSDGQRDAIRRNARQQQTTGSGKVVIDREIQIGDDLPDSVEFESFPDTVYTEVPEIRSYRYIVRDRDIYLVDPTERRVIEIIR